MPERVQQRRIKGWQKPDGAISAARPHKWGNPFEVGNTQGCCGSIRLLSFLHRGAVELGEVMKIGRPQRVAGVEATLGLEREAPYGSAPQVTGGEVGPGEVVELPVQSCLARLAVRVELQRVQVHPPVSRGHKLDPVRSPIGLHLVPQPVQHGKRLGLLGHVDVQVEVAVCPRLPSDERIDAPAAFEPCGYPGFGQGVEHAEHLVEPHPVEIWPCHVVIMPSAQVGETPAWPHYAHCGAWMVPPL
jgi:hypothetical protein